MLYTVSVVPTNISVYRLTGNSFPLSAVHCTDSCIKCPNFGLLPIDLTKF